MENPALLVLALCVCVAKGLGYDPSFHQTHQTNGFQALQKGQGIVSPGRVASRHRNWCAFAVTRAVSCVTEDGVESYVKPDYQRCVWGQCPRALYRVFRRPRYRVAYKMVTEMEWKCCHGYTGDDCCDATRVVTDTEVIAVRPPVAPTGPRGGCEPGGGGGGDGDGQKVRQLEEKIRGLTKHLHTMQTTLTSVTSTLSGLTGVGVPADAGRPPMKDTIHHIQNRLDQLSNRSQVHDQTLLRINHRMQEGGGNTVDGSPEGTPPPGVKLHTLKEEILTQLEGRVALSCSSCQAGVEDLRRQQKTDQDRIRSLEKLLGSLAQDLRRSEETSRRETGRSSACCSTLEDLGARLASVELRLGSSSAAHDVLKGRLDKELSGAGGGGKGRVTEERLSGRLRELEKRLNTTVRKAEQRCSNTGSNMKDVVQREVAQLRNAVFRLLDDHAFRIGKVELDLTVLGDTVTAHSGRLGRLENATALLERGLVAAANACSEACGPDRGGGATEDAVKTLQWRVVSNQDDLRRFDTRLRDLSVSGDSLKDLVDDLGEDLKRIQGETGAGRERLGRVLTEVETLGRGVARCAVCRTVEGDLRAFSNATGAALARCEEGLEDLRRRSAADGSACSQVCSTLQEEVGRLREEVEACGRRCDDGLADLREELGNRTARLDGALGEAGVAMAALNGSLQSARWTLQQYGGDLLDLSSANDDIIADVNSIQGELQDHLEDSGRRFSGLDRLLTELRSDVLTEVGACRSSSEGLERRLARLEALGGRLDAVSVGLRSVKTGLNRHVSGLWRHLEGLNVTVTTQGGAIQDLERVQLVEVRSRVGALNTTLLNLTQEFHRFSTQDFMGPAGLPGLQGERGEPGSQGRHGPEGKEGPEGREGGQGLVGPPGLRGEEGAAGSDAAVPRLSFSAALTSSMTKSGTIVFNKVLVNDQNAYNPGTGYFTALSGGGTTSAPR
ncbi:unnamed protein product [Gadus morhua 'NCC']